MSSWEHEDNVPVHSHDSGWVPLGTLGLLKVTAYGVGVRSRATVRTGGGLDDPLSKVRDTEKLIHWEIHTIYIKPITRAEE